MTAARELIDEYLVLAILTGDRSAGERLAERWRPRLLRTARRILGDAELAEEAVQDCWLKIWRGLDRLRDPATFPAWAFAILHRVCMDRLRGVRASRMRAAPLDDDPSEACAPCSGGGGGGDGDAGADRLDAARALAGLSPALRAAAVLYYGEGLRLDEIALALGVSPGAAKSRLFEARRAMKARLNPEGD